VKSYDRSYFDRWYRDPDDRVATRESLERKARMAIALTEFLIGRKIRSVLDVGCGEAAWHRIVKRFRPNARYVGVDSSEYVLERFGASRNIRRGTLGTLGAMALTEGQPEKARTRFEASLRADPRNVPARLLLAAVEEQAGRKAQARRWCEEAGAIAPGAPEVAPCLARNAQ